MIKYFPKQKLTKSLTLCFPPLVSDPVNVKPVEKLLVSGFRTILNLPTVGLQKLVETENSSTAADRNYSPTLSPPILKQNSSALSASFIYISIVR